VDFKRKIQNNNEMNVLKIKKYIKLGIGKVRNNFSVFIFEKTGKFIPKPTKVYYMISNKCNFKCKMCPQWEQGKKENQKEYISENRIKEIINEMKKNNIKEFGISGGEPMIYKKKALSLLKYANKKGIYTHFATNGSLLTKEILDEYDKTGGGHISLSLDAIGDKHDALRGFKGSYENVIKVIELFKKNSFKNINLKINITLNNENISQIMPVLEKAKSSGALVFIQPYDTYDYGNKDIDRKIKKYPLWVKKENYKKLENLVDDLVMFKKNNSEILLNDEKHIKSFFDYFAKSDFYIKCYAPMDQITIDPFGNIILCKFGKIFDLKINTLKDYIKSEKRKKIIKAGLECKEGCLLGCMFKPGFFSLMKNGARQFLKLIK
jgi:MoaA/NifB/PqqE/SkfB family radical SAM enzyme